MGGKGKSSGLQRSAAAQPPCGLLHVNAPPARALCAPIRQSFVDPLSVWGLMRPHSFLFRRRVVWGAVWERPQNKVRGLLTSRPPRADPAELRAVAALRAPLLHQGPPPGPPPAPLTALLIQHTARHIKSTAEPRPFTSRGECIKDLLQVRASITLHTLLW